MEGVSVMTNTFGFWSFWIVMIAFIGLILYGGDRPWIIFGRVAAMIALLLFGLYFLLGAQPRMWG
jgi:hypothetical protein